MIYGRLSARLLDCKSKKSFASLGKHRILVYLPTLLHYLQKKTPKQTKTMQNKNKPQQQGDAQRKAPQNQTKTPGRSGF